MSRKNIFRIALFALAFGTGGAAAWYAFHFPKKPAAGPNGSPVADAADLLDQRFSQQVRPFLESYCFNCHGSNKPKADFDLTRDATAADVAKNVRQWETVLERLHSMEMPPKDAPRHPGPDERAAVVSWIRDLRDREAERNSGDPGPVLARRLSNAEFDYTIRDLTGVDLRPTREFPVDPANEAGFDNSGESLAMSPALLKKYLAAARSIADHLVLKPDGFVFAPHPVVTDTDRDKYCVQRIVDFYDRHKVDYADYFFAAWQYQHREALDRRRAELADFAGRLSLKYLEKLRALLAESPPASGPLGEVQAQWRKLPDATEPIATVRRECERLRDRVLSLRKGIPTRTDKLNVNGISNGSQPLLLWRNAQLAAQHMRGPADADARFCRIFPDTFVVMERAPYYDVGSSPKGRLLSAGFHLMHGYFRDDGPLCELVLYDNEQRELDALWDELNFITLSPMRQYKDFIFFERAEPPRFMRDAEFDFARSEDKDCTSEAKMNQLADAYLAKARKQGATGDGEVAIKTYFTQMSATIRRVEKARAAAEPSHLAALADFAQRAYRRPLAPAERDDLLAFYRNLRQKDELPHEDALRDSLASVLMSPHFCYRFDLAPTSRERERPVIQPLSDYELASRLSYFLWSSMPDAELLAHAAAGDLRQRDVLIEQTRRMSGSPKVRGLATEFAGNWLDFRRFKEHNSVDRDRFPSFTNELRKVMFEEPILYFSMMVRADTSVLDLLFGTDTFVNGPLARHYGMPEPENPDEWVWVADADRYGRGGLLPMAVFQTKNAPGLRTSPVKRGYWVVRRVLGEQIPPPPPTVPELPKDEAKLGNLTLPQLLARHQADESCAGCHRRFDSVGLVFEEFGPVGERRTKDLGGKPVQTVATFPDGIDRNGMAGLREYLRDKRQDDFVDNLCKKLFSYALGRSLLLSDKKALDEMRAKLKADGYRFGSLVESIVLSPQFLNKRQAENRSE